MIWGLSNYAAKDSISLSAISAKDRDVLENRVKALLARLVWRTEGYFEVYNRFDPAIKKAMEEISK